MLVIDHNKKIYEQLYEQIKKQILSGELKPGTRLQATRGLAQEYGISRNSVVAAYEQLLVEEIVGSTGVVITPARAEKIKGSGTKQDEGDGSGIMLRDRLRKLMADWGSHPAASSVNA